jgi:hypothetical protein
MRYRENGAHVHRMGHIYKHITKPSNILTLRFAQRSKNHEPDTSTLSDITFSSSLYQFCKNISGRKI